MAAMEGNGMWIQAKKWMLLLGTKKYSQLKSEPHIWIRFK